MREKQMVTVLREARENPDAPQRLNEKQRLSLLKFTTHRCSNDTKALVARNIGLPFNQWPGRWAIDRLFIDLETDEVTYCAGQDYDHEIKQLRKQLVEWR